MYQVAIIEENKCIGCKICIQTCPEPNAIIFIASKKKSKIVATKCKACGICIVKCPKEAIKLLQLK